MKNLALIAFMAIIGAASCAPATATQPHKALAARTAAEDGTCSGGSGCSACTNCKYCKNCSKEGGTCSVCK